MQRKLYFKDSRRVKIKSVKFQYLNTAEEESITETEKKFLTISKILRESK